MNIAANAPSPLINVARLAGGGDSDPANNTAANEVNFPPVVDSTPTPIPVNTPFGLALLLTMLGVVGARQLRGRRH